MMQIILLVFCMGVERSFLLSENNGRCCFAKTKMLQ
jgi:hypothetical protein